MRGTAALYLFAGCSFAPGSPPGGAATDDAHVIVPGDGVSHFLDAPADAPDGCDGVGSFAICLSSQPGGSLDLPDTQIDTTTCAGGELVDPHNGGPTLCVIAAGTILVTGTVRAVGPNPLVLDAHAGNLVVDQYATIDVASYHSGASGAGGSDGHCTPSSPGAASNAGSGGGAGGSFGTAGGAGGSGATSASGGNAALSSGTPTFVRGGCRGANGGVGMQGGPGFGGAGGGAIYLLAHETLEIAGHIDASGAGADPTPSNKNGGGGGGSGGMIVLYATHISSSGSLWANGGGGAGGAEGGATSQPGHESSAPTSSGTGGTHIGNAGDGAAGATIDNAAGNGGPGAKGGGGGGGGLGVIHVIAGGTLGGTVSPSPT